MIIIRKTLCLFILVGFQLSLLGNELPSNAELRDLMLKNWGLIEDYEVDIKLSLDIPGFRMPSRSIHYLYKAPDMSKVEVKGFAIVPKQGIQPFITFLKDSLTFKILADTMVNNKAVFEVAIDDTFMNRAGRISFYVDQRSGSIYEAWVIHDKHEFFHLNSEYTELKGITLPQSTEIKMQFPPEFKNIQRLGKKPTDMKTFNSNMTDEWVEGSISIKFDNYKVNQGIPDYRFEDDAEDTIQD